MTNHDPVSEMGDLKAEATIGYQHGGWVLCRCKRDGCCNLNIKRPSQQRLSYTDAFQE